jgi:hypothetical protein
MNHSSFRAGFSKEIIHGAFLRDASFIKNFSDTIIGENKYIVMDSINLIALDALN